MLQHSFTRGCCSAHNFAPRGGTWISFQLLPKVTIFFGGKFLLMMPTGSIIQCKSLRPFGARSYLGNLVVPRGLLDCTQQCLENWASNQGIKCYLSVLSLYYLSGSLFAFCLIRVQLGTTSDFVLKGHSFPVVLREELYAVPGIELEAAACEASALIFVLLLQLAI